MGCLKLQRYFLGALLLIIASVAFAQVNDDGLQKNNDSGLDKNVSATTKNVDPQEGDEAEQNGLSWPRELTIDGDEFVIYQPQLEEWKDNVLSAHAAVSVKKLGSDQETFGTIWISSFTEVDKEENLVSLEDCKITKGTFPKFEDDGESLVVKLRSKLSDKVRVVSLGRLEAALALADAIQAGDRQKVKNDPPEIIYSDSPSMLVLIDGKPALRPMTGSELLRVINTRALILMDKSNGKYALHLLGEWVTADKIDGPWTLLTGDSSRLDQAMKTLSENNQVDLLNIDDDASDDKVEKFNAKDIKVFVRTKPAELIQTEGKADFAPIDGTKLLYVKNTNSQIFMNTADQNYYVVLSGRWFRSKSLTGKSWSFVKSDELPEDFAKIPESHPSGAVLTSVAGTDEAREAAIANTIPQTATIKRSEASMEADYDGEPEFAPIESTSLSYVVNSDIPIIRVKENEFYAVEDGVWFTAGDVNGPWSVAESVPAEIYTIPASSPLHYVTYVRVYRSDPEYVEVGYTPGYYGTYTNPEGVVVYGSGYSYPAYVGNVWYGYPSTYGYGANFSYGYNTGFAFGFTAGLAVGAWSNPWWGPYRYRHGGSHHHVSFNHVNLYNRWGNNVHVDHFKRYGRDARYRRYDRREPGRRPDKQPRRDNLTRDRRGDKQYRTGEYKRNNNVFSSRDGSVYRKTNKGWDSYSQGKWQSATKNNSKFSAQKSRRLNKDNVARDRGNARTRNYNSGTRSSRSGGFSGGSNRGGYRGGSPSRSTRSHRSSPSGGGRSGGSRGGRGGGRR